jgi:hypothetical protein
MSTTATSNCSPTAPPPEVPVCNPPQYSSLYPPLAPTSTQVAQLRSLIKSQIKAESLRRAGIQGSDPWGDAEDPTQAHWPQASTHYPPGSAMPYTAANPLEPGLLTHGPALPFMDPTVLSQPQTLINKRVVPGANGSPQILNHEITYYAPTYSTNDHKECINCCEDCCEDVCENCFLNCCLDCSKISNLTNLLFGASNAKNGKNGSEPQYVLLENAIPLNPMNGYPMNPINPVTGLPANTNTIGNIG